MRGFLGGGAASLAIAEEDTASLGAEDDFVFLIDLIADDHENVKIACEKNVI